MKGPEVFLASHASDAEKGHELYVDGGILANIAKEPTQANKQGSVKRMSKKAHGVPWAFFYFDGWLHP